MPSVIDITSGTTQNTFHGTECNIVEYKFSCFQILSVLSYILDGECLKSSSTWMIYSNNICHFKFCLKLHSSRIWVSWTWNKAILKTFHNQYMQSIPVQYLELACKRLLCENNSHVKIKKGTLALWCLIEENLVPKQFHTLCACGNGPWIYTISPGPHCPVDWAVGNWGRCLLLL